MDDETFDNGDGLEGDAIEAVHPEDVISLDDPTDGDDAEGRAGGAHNDNAEGRAGDAENDVAEQLRTECAESRELRLSVLRKNLKSWVGCQRERSPLWAFFSLKM